MVAPVRLGLPERWLAPIPLKPQTTEALMDSHKRSTDAAMLDRLDRLIKRLEMDGAYVDAGIVHWAAMRLRDLIEADKRHQAFLRAL